MTASEIDVQLRELIAEIDDRLRSQERGWTVQQAEEVGLKMAWWAATKVREEMMQMVCASCGSVRCDDAVLKVTKAQWLYERLDEAR